MKVKRDNCIKTYHKIVVEYRFFLPREQTQV